MIEATRFDQQRSCSSVLIAKFVSLCGRLGTDFAI
jgi:hypothetical protein